MLFLQVMPRELDVIEVNEEEERMEIVEEEVMVVGIFQQGTSSREIIHKQRRTATRR